MRCAVLLSMVLLGFGCNEPAGPSPQQLDALLQRLDTMSRRLDELEQAVEREELAPTAEAESLPPEVSRDPSIALAAEPREPESLRVDIGPDSLVIDGVELSRDDAADRFREVAKDAPHTRLVLLASPEVEYAEMVEILDLAREAGLTEVAMSARVHGEAEPATAR